MKVLAKIFKHMILCAAAVIVCVGISITAMAQQNIASGVINEDYGHITWVIDGNGKLTVTGTGNWVNSRSYMAASDVPWNEYREEIRSADIDLTGMVHGNYLFADCINLESVDLSGLDTSNVTDMYAMFSNCQSLKSLNLRNFDTSNVKDMRRLFYNCASLESLDLSSFDTSNIESVYNMFVDCKSLKEINLSTFDTKNVTSFSYMFDGCESLESLDLRSFDTTNINKMNGMFYECYRLKSLNLSSFNTSNVKDMNVMFYKCYSLENLDLRNFNTSNVTDMSYMFAYCSNLKKLNLSSFNTSNVKDMQGMFNQCHSIESLDVSRFDTGKVTDMYNMFKDCHRLKSLNLSSFNTSNVETMTRMFEGCSRLKTINVSGFDTRKVTSFSGMFNECLNLEKLDISSFDMRSVEYNYDLFYGCKKLKQVKLPKNSPVSFYLSYQSAYEWKMPDGTVVREVPANLSSSITITRVRTKDIGYIFYDLSKGKWYEDYVWEVYSRELMTGTSGKFNPNNNVTRAQVVTILYRIAGEPVVVDYSACDVFSDVKMDKYYTEAVCWAYNEGIATGNNGKFDTTGNLTRQQLAAFLFRFASVMEYDVSARKNYSSMVNANQVSGYAEEAVSWAVATGLISGSERKDANGKVVYNLNPRGNTSRAQLAAILVRLCDSYDL